MSSKNVGTAYEIIECDKPDYNKNFHYCENLKSHTCLNITSTISRKLNILPAETAGDQDMINVPKETFPAFSQKRMKR
jgi:hypothetical protein